MAQTDKRKIQDENLTKEKEIQVSNKYYFKLINLILKKIQNKTISDLRAQLRIAQAAASGAAAHMEITTIWIFKQLILHAQQIPQ